MENENKIEWIISNKKISFWNIFYFGIPLNFIVLFIIFYFVVFPFSSKFIFTVGIYVIISTISSIISSILIFVVSLDVYPYKIGFSTGNIHFKNRWGRIRTNNLTEIDCLKKKNNNSIQIIKKKSKGRLEIRVDPNVLDTLIKIFEKYKNRIESI